MFGNRKKSKALLVLVTALVTLMLTSTAFADRIQWSKRKVNESNTSWRLDMKFFLSKAPDIAHVPMRFEFTPYTYFERSMVDGKDEPIDRRVPLKNKQPLVETVDVGFMDPSSGKTQSRTRFTFKLTRDRGFEAGEYKVSVKNKRNGRKMGAAITLTLNGENEVIDRRSMDFSSGKKKKKEEKKEEEVEQEMDPSEDPNSEAYWASGPTEAETDEGSLPPPAHLREKPGPCGCRLPGHSRSPGNVTWLLVAGLVLPMLRRVRR